jgi:hypothetical protein
MNNSLNNVKEPIDGAPPEIREIIERVLELERERMSKKNSRNINDDILKIIKQVVQ